MKIFDAHCDVLTKILDKKECLRRNTGHFDLVRATQYDHFIQVLAVFIDPKYYVFPMARCKEVITNAMQEIENNQLTICLQSSDLSMDKHSINVSGIFSLEGGEPIEDQLNHVEILYNLGIRSIMLTWNHSNQIATGCMDHDLTKGLTPFGREVVGEMNRLGILVDVSHLSERSFWEVSELVTTFFASHSNAKALCNHPRNLSDTQLGMLKEKKGMVGLNAYPLFLNSQGSADLQDLVRHIEHVLGIMGEDHVGLGLDLDGIENLPLGFLGVESYEQIANLLSRMNYSETCINKIMWKNFYNYYLKHLKNSIQ